MYSCVTSQIATLQYLHTISVFYWFQSNLHFTNCITDFVLCPVAASQHTSLGFQTDVKHACVSITHRPTVPAAQCQHGDWTSTMPFHIAGPLRTMDYKQEH